MLGITAVLTIVFLASAPVDIFAKFRGVRKRDLHHWPSAVCIRTATLVAEMKAKNIINVFGLWIHGGRFRPFKRAELHRIELADIDHVSDGRKETVHSETVEINAVRKLVKAEEDGLWRS